jgi:hypothetical protein
MSRNEPSKGATPVISDSRVTFLVRIWDSAHPGSYNHDATLALTELLSLRSSSERLRSQVEQLREQNEKTREALSNLLVMLPSVDARHPGQSLNDRIPQSFCFVRWIDISEARALFQPSAALPERAP